MGIHSVTSWKMKLLSCFFDNDSSIHFQTSFADFSKPIKATGLTFQAICRLKSASSMAEVSNLRPHPGIFWPFFKDHWFLRLPDRYWEIVFAASHDLISKEDTYGWRFFIEKGLFYQWYIFGACVICKKFLRNFQNLLFSPERHFANLSFAFHYFQKHTI